jgi:sulfite exporter TauE/SafE
MREGAILSLVRAIPLTLLGEMNWTCWVRFLIDAEGAVRVVHIVLLAGAATACVVIAVASGLPWAGSAAAVLLASRAARSAFLLAPRVANAQTATPIARTIGMAHGVGYCGAAVLFVASALAAETSWSGAMALAMFAAGLLSFWLVRR